MPLFSLILLRGRGTRLRRFSLQSRKNMPNLHVRGTMGDPGTPCRCQLRPKGVDGVDVSVVLFTLGGTWVINADTVENDRAFR